MSLPASYFPASILGGGWTMYTRCLPSGDTAGSSRNVLSVSGVISGFRLPLRTLYSTSPAVSAMISEPEPLLGLPLGSFVGGAETGVLVAPAAGVVVVPDAGMLAASAGVFVAPEAGVFLP